ncbi:unnamed protein product [Rhizophagus irregularis]|nr:unnamed protein product [Rhizophagus irregularis]
MDSSKTDYIPRGKLETSSDYDYSNATERETPAFCTKFNVHCQEGEDCQIHVRYVSSLRAGIEEPICNRHENEKNEDTGIFSEFCTNRRRIKNMQTLFGKLRRVCILEDAKREEEESSAKACNYVLALHSNENDVSERSMCILPTASERVGSEGLGDSLYMVVDTFVDESVRRNLASYILCDLPTNSADPDKLGCYYKCVAEFGFNHIIVIGEMLYGLLFIDCYRRVFQWEDMEQVLWPVGDSLEDMKPYKDLVVWTVEDGIVYEISKGMSTGIVIFCLKLILSFLGCDLIMGVKMWDFFSINFLLFRFFKTKFTKKQSLKEEKEEQEKKITESKMTL